MGAWGANALTGLLLHLGLGEPGRGDLLPASCRGGEGRWGQRGSGFSWTQTLVYPRREGNGWVGRGPRGGLTAGQLFSPLT